MSTSCRHQYGSEHHAASLRSQAEAGSRLRTPIDNSAIGDALLLVAERTRPRATKHRASAAAEATTTMPSSTRLLALLTVFSAVCENAAVASRRIRDSDASDDSSSGEKRYDFSLDKAVSKGVVKNLDALAESRSGSEELHIEKNDFIDVSWQKRHPERIRVKRKTATVALDVKDNTYRVWTHVYPPAALPAVPALPAVAAVPAVPAVPYGVAAMYPPALAVDPFYTGYPVTMGGISPAPLPAMAYTEYADASAYYHGWYSSPYSLPYAALPWAPPMVGTGFLGPDAAAPYLPGYPDAAGYYSALPDLSWAGLDPADYMQ